MNPSATHWSQTLPYRGVDLETTGLSPTLDRPVSAGVITLTPNGGWAPMPEFPLLVHPGMDALPIPEAVIAIHGITTRKAMKEGVPLAEALEKTNQALMEGCASGWPIVAFNARFDLTILDHCSRLNGVPTLHDRAHAEGVDVCVLDPLVLDRWWDRYRPGRRRMKELCPHYGVGRGICHDAEVDALVAAEMARELLRRALADQSGDVWREARSRELRACSTPADMHALQQEWNTEWSQGLRGRGPCAREGSEHWPLIPYRS